MIAYLTGQVIHVDANQLTLLTNGVGYTVTVPITMPITTGQELSLHIHTNMNDSSISLYGFTTPEELEVFRKLLSVSGIGPKAALSLIGLGTDLLLQAIQQSDDRTISKTPGIGPKTASRLILELRDKISDLSVPTATPTDDQRSSKLADARSALESLGYDTLTASQSLKNVPTDLSTEDMVKWALSSIGSD